MTSSALLTDRYELTMLESALRDGTANRRCVFEVFARSLPAGRRYGVVAGTGRVLEEINKFVFSKNDIAFLENEGIINQQTADYLSDYRFSGNVFGYPEGDLYFPNSPVLTVTGTFAETVILETLILSILNHDSAIASAASRMVHAAKGRPLIEMGGRRTHERAAVAAARAAMIAGFASTSNLAAAKQYGLPTVGTAAHAFTLLHDSEDEAFKSQIDALGKSTTLLVDTYDLKEGIDKAIAAAGPDLGAIRIDSGSLAQATAYARDRLDEAGCANTKIIVSGDMNEFTIEELADAPINAFGVGTSLVTGSGAPTAGMVYKLVAVEGRPVAKRSSNKASVGGMKLIRRSLDSRGILCNEFYHTENIPAQGIDQYRVQLPMMQKGSIVTNGYGNLKVWIRTHNEMMSQLPSSAKSITPGSAYLTTVSSDDILLGTERN